VTLPLPSPRLAIVAAVAVATLWFIPDLGQVKLWVLVLDGRFIALNAALGLVAVIDGLLAPSPREFDVQRQHPRAITLGQDSSITWEVATRRPRRRLWSSKRVWLADDLAPSLRADTRRVELKPATEGSTRATVGLHPTRRGRFEPSEIVVRTSGPLGLINRQRKRQEPTTLKVLPPFRSAREAELILRRARILEIGLRSARGRGGGTEFDSLRELTPDDETRRIDWAATARSQRPIVRTYRAERNQTVLCLLDSGRTMAGRVEGVPRMEHAMDGAMLMAELATGLGDRVGLVAFDQAINTTIEPSNRRSQRARIAERLFDLEPALAESDYQEAVTHLLGRYRRRSFVVIFTELGQEAIEQFLAPVLPLLIRTHVVVVAAVRDPDLIHWTTSTTLDEDGAFLRAAAIAALNDREVLAARLQAMGATVVDVQPADFASALGDVYLNVKAAGRL